MGRPNTTAAVGSSARRAERPTLPPATWVSRVDLSTNANHGVSVHWLLDRQQALISWFAQELPPEAAGVLDPVDGVIARGLGLLAESTRRTSQRNPRLWAPELGVRGSRAVRLAPDAAVSSPDEIERRLRRGAASPGTRAGTRRVRMSALTSVVAMVFEAGLARRPLQLELPPKDVDADLRPASLASIVAAHRHLSQQDTPGALRLLTLLHLALCGVRPKELAALTHEAVHLEGNALMVDGHRIVLTKAARKVLAAWLRYRGRFSGPLFLGFEHSIASTPIANQPVGRRFAAKGISVRQIQREFADLKELLGLDDLLDVRALRRRRIVDATGIAAAVRIARVRNPSDPYRIRAARGRQGRKLATDD